MNQLLATVAASLLLAGCALQAGPVGFAFGQAAICRGSDGRGAETYYGALSGEVEVEVCPGGYVSGGAISEPATRALGTLGRATVRAGQALGAPVPPMPPPKEECPGC